MPKTVNLLHLTHTGFYAGMSFCGIDRKAAEIDGDRFFHPGYGCLTTETIREGKVAMEGKLIDICADCAAVWLDED